MFLEGTAVLHADGCRQVHAGDAGLYTFDGGAQICALQLCGNGDESLQVLAADFVLWRELRDGGHGAEGGGVAGGRVEDGVANGIEVGAAFRAESDADGVGAAVGNEWFVGGDAVEDGGGVFCEFSGCEAEAAGELRINLETGGGAADGVVDAILDADDAGDVGDLCCDAWGDLLEEGEVFAVELDLDGLGCIGEVVDVVLKHLKILGVELGDGGFDLGADVGDDVVDGAAAFGFELDGDVAGVGLSDGGEAHLQAGAAADAFDLCRVVEDGFDPGEHRLRGLERAAGGHDVVEYEAAFVHAGQKVRTEAAIGDSGEKDEC